MSRYIDAEIIKLLMKQDRLLQGNCEYELWKQEVDRQVNALPSIELDDYVPREFHDKTCEAMAQMHQEEIANMVSVVRCKDCKHWIGETEHYEDREYKACWQLCGQYMGSEFWCKYGEREGEPQTE